MDVNNGKANNRNFMNPTFEVGECSRSAEESADEVLVPLFQAMYTRYPSGKTSKEKPSLVVNINESCKKLSLKQPSIFRVPKHLRRLNENAYTPCHVSIGPFHHQDDKYSVMEEHKLVYTRDLILRRRKWAKVKAYEDAKSLLKLGKENQDMDGGHMLEKQEHSKSHKDDVKGKKPQIIEETSSMRVEVVPISEEEIDAEEMEAYVGVVKRLEDEARKSYAEKLKLNMEEFVNMLLIDGCFIVEFLCRKIRKLSYMEGGTTTSNVGESTKAGGTFNGMYSFIEIVYEEWEPAKDFIFQSTRTSFEVRRDLTLLENQLPYVVLESLFEFTFPRATDMFGQRPKFHEIVYCALRTSIPNTTNVLTKQDVENRIENPEMTAHFVSFLRMCCGPIPTRKNVSGERERIAKQPGSESSNSTQNNISRFSTSEEQEIPAYATDGDDSCYRQQIISSLPANSERRIDIDHIGEFPCLCNMETPHDIRVPSVTKLAKAGVLFEKTCSKSKTPLLDIQFDSRRGVLRMPPLTMWHHTETFFRNVMAHELYNHTANSKTRSVSDYMCFMDDLISSKDDVALLVQSGIIQNWLESDQVVADLFNSVTRHILADYSSYSDICRQLNSFRKKYNVRWLKAILQQEYFSQPWAIVYFIAFVIIQTTASLIQAVTSLQSGN